MDFIEIYENAFSNECCDATINFFELSKQKKPGHVLIDNKNTVVKEIKDSTDICLDFRDRTEVTDSIFKCLNDYFYLYIQKYDCVQTTLNSLRPHGEFNIQRYYPGQGYSKVHCEHSSKNCITVFAWMIYLNSVEGGGTEFTNYNKVLECKKGSLVIWPAYWTHSHRGIISNKDTKYIATGWIDFL